MMAAGGMCRDISPVSLTCTLGQQLSMQAAGSSDDSVSAREGHKSQVVSSQVGASPDALFGFFSFDRGCDLRSGIIDWRFL